MITFSWRRRLVGFFALSAMVFAATSAPAETFPSRPIRMIVAWAPGTPGDVAGRLIAESMATALGQPIVVDNRPGAGGTVGLSELLRQPADGYTLFMLGAPGALLMPLLYPAIKVDLQSSLTPVGTVVFSYNVLVTSPSKPYKNAKDLAAAVKNSPGQISFSSAGNGTPAHLAGEMLSRHLNSQAMHVPYNQIGMALSDVMAGRVDFMFLTASAAVPQIAGGKLRALATSGPRRLPALPDVPTMVEQGYPGFVVRAFEMLTTKTGTPPDIVQRLNAELNKALASPSVQEKLAGVSLEPKPMSIAESKALLVSEQATLVQFGRTISLKAD
ncbi:tripartite tricarboxylate transporter substrate binding protein [Variovorax sp. J31P179]|uniref:Bug family tripartite tricarboxylate transporter substrate binding protein n=1 Tax=Variovorax sp. J31P179 TaxID=3053508 RepID=UPI0025755302|nr:tripartite tricarboxylate transporter substrate binding protein [Variovorax sp. J31P179]MDM0085371.1 tripartite tricarboxylate transporter substrate binding protein [Variovorax sp. J31P179]